MTQGNPIFLGSSEIGVFGKKRDYWGIEIAEPTTVERDAGQQCDDALGDGRDVVRRVRVIPPGVSIHIAGEVLLVNNRAMPDDNHAVGSSFRSFGKARS